MPRAADCVGRCTSARHARARLHAPWRRCCRVCRVSGKGRNRLVDQASVRRANHRLAYVGATHFPPPFGAVGMARRERLRGSGPSAVRRPGDRTWWRSRECPERLAIGDSAMSSSQVNRTVALAGAAPYTSGCFDGLGQPARQGSPVHTDEEAESCARFLILLKEIASMKAREFQRWLRKRGCSFETHKGGSGHLTVRRGDRTSQLPMHGSRRELGTKLIAKIKKDLDL